MLIRYHYNRKSFNFINPTKVAKDSNVFTIIVGKNGTGKSRLISSIVSEFIKIPYRYRKRSELESFLHYSGKGNLEFTHTPTQVITASTSPFDRFPINNRVEQIAGYSYLGLRDLSSQNFGLSYMSKIISSLIEAFIHDPSRMNQITYSLNYLGYTDEIAIRLESRFTSRMAHELIESENPIDVFERHMRPGIFNSYINRRFFYSEGQSIDLEKLNHLIILLKSYIHNSSSSLFKSRKHINIGINRFGIRNQDLFDIPPNDLIFLLHSGLLRLREVNLERIESKSSYSISEASSGEQSVVMSILGIASQIKDGALICIDEPEICLHPEWQEKYIKLLIDTFKPYNGCHFLIATHSPQIISKLEPENCFVLSMDDGQVTDADLLINNSVDYQLANVFDSPGFKNEYLSRIALSIFTKVSSRKKFDVKDLENYKVLISQENVLERNDPVYTLLQALKKMHKVYAGDKQ